MFLFSSESLNYTQARNSCHKWNASLAHVISEERTEGLGKLVSQNVSSFVGLSSSNEERIWKNEFGIRNSCPPGFICSLSSARGRRGDSFGVNPSELFGNSKDTYNLIGEPLSCFDYRAWGEGEPSHSKGCVVLVNPSKSSPPFWKLTSCRISLPFICEVSPLLERSSSRRHGNRHHDA
jgi:hypothetical protein